MLSRVVIVAALAVLAEPSEAKLTTAQFCMPTLTQRWSVITSGDAAIGAHNLDGGVLVFGALSDPLAASVNPNPVPIAQKSYISSFAAGTSAANYHFNGGLESPIAAPSPVTFSDFEAATERVRSGVWADYKAGGGVGEATAIMNVPGQNQPMMIVIDQGNGAAVKEYGMDNLMALAPTMTFQGYDQGRTLVAFLGSAPVRLKAHPNSNQQPWQGPPSNSQGLFTGIQWGPSVLAPYAHVDVDDDAGFVDGFIIAKSLTANSPNLQLHGKNFDGYDACPAGSGGSSGGGSSGGVSGGGVNGGGGVSARKDPHLRFAHGGVADFRGEDGGVYNLLSSPNVSWAVKFSASDLAFPHKLVHGTTMASAYWTMRTSPSNRLVTVEYSAPTATTTTTTTPTTTPTTTTAAATAAASSRSVRRAVVRVAGPDNSGVWRSSNVHPLKAASSPPALGDQVFGADAFMSHEMRGSTSGAYNLEREHGSAEVGASLYVENVKIELTGRSLSVRLEHKWSMKATVAAFPYAHLNANKSLLDVEATALYDADHDVVAPHGLIGQSYDGDQIAIDGRRDVDVKEGEVTTSAQAEGAIEGAPTDYRLAYPFATQFKYSRFDAVAAAHRDISRLTGKRRRANSGNNAKSLGVASAVSFEEKALSGGGAERPEGTSASTTSANIKYDVASTVEAWSARVQGWVGMLLG